MDIMGILKGGLAGLVPGLGAAYQGYNAYKNFNKPQAQPNMAPQMLPRVAPRNDRPDITDDMIRNAAPLYRNLPQGQHEFSGAVDNGSPILNKTDTTNYSQNPNLYQGGPQWQNWMNDVIGRR